ncbi:flocculation protein FLO11 isoform X1 [Stegastes partitus]|nr:PREDICTED: P-selectin glycoprotein ligand 1 isoform X1 [Stegastes partitus]
MPAATPAATPAAPPAAPPTSPDHRLLHSTTAAGEAQRTHSTTITETAHHAQDQFHQPSATTFTDKTAATSVAFVATVVASSPQPTSIVKPEITSQLPSTVSPDESSKMFNQSLSSPSASAATAATTNATSEATPAFNPTSLPGATTEKSKPGTELPSTSQSVSATGISTDAAGSSSTATSISTPNSTATNSSAGILVPGKPKRLPVPTTEPTPATTATRQVSKSPSSGTEAQPCSNRGVVKQCLIVIAALAVLATIFMVSTIVLCTKLSARKYKVKKPQQATEMMCISSLLPETTYSYTRQRNPVRNGILVIPGGGDSDEELGDNLTLSSFLPDNDRYV